MYAHFYDDVMPELPDYNFENLPGNRIKIDRMSIDMKRALQNEVGRWYNVIILDTDSDLYTMICLRFKGCPR